MNPVDFDTCVYCPRLCRHVCPVAVGSGREAATPTSMMTGVWAWLRGQLDAASALRLASLCTGCGACEEACLVSRPVSALLSAARGALAPAPVCSPLGHVEGGGRLVAIESDERRWAEALSRHLGQPVARLRTTDQLCAVLLDHPQALAEHAARLRDRLGGRVLVTISEQSRQVAEAAELVVEPLLTLIPVPVGIQVAHHPCRGAHLDAPTAPDALACCGARAPLSTTHPQIAAEVGAEAARRLLDFAEGRVIHSPDCQCAAWLRAQGAPVQDPVDWLLASDKEPS